MSLATSIIILIIGTAYTVLWILMFYSGAKLDPMFDILNNEDFRYHELFRVGGKIMELSRYQYNSKADRRLRQQLSILYQPKYTEYYLRVVYAQRATMASVVMFMAFPVYAFSENIAFFFLVVALAGFTFYYYGTLVKEKIDARNDEIINEFCEAVSKLALLTNAGAILKEAWREVAEDGEGLLYEEMRLALDDMNNGISDADAIYKFGTRCMVPEVKKFASTVIQGISRGNRELSDGLQQQSAELWTLKQQLVKRQAEKANSKLLIPMCLMFIGVLIMIIVPIFSNIGGF